MNLVIVESPAKAKTINKYLGGNYTVLASYGHIRDLPSKNGSVDPKDKFKAADSNSIHLASATDPVYYIEGGKLNIFLEVSPLLHK